MYDRSATNQISLKIDCRQEIWNLNFDELNHNQSQGATLHTAHDVDAFETIRRAIYAVGELGVGTTYQPNFSNYTQ